MYCNVCNKYRQFKRTKISLIFNRTLILSIAYSKYGHEYERIFIEEESIDILNILGLINNKEDSENI